MTPKNNKPKNLPLIYMQNADHPRLNKRENDLSLENYNNSYELSKEIGDNDLAIKNYKSAIKYRPNYPEAFNNLGTSLHQVGNLNEAIQNFNAAINVDHYFFYIERFEKVIGKNK